MSVRLIIKIEYFFNAVLVSFCYITCDPKTLWLETSWASLVWPDLADLCVVDIRGQLMGQLEVR